MRDQLFLLDATTTNEQGVKGYCPDCAMVKGYLAFYPQVEAKLQIAVVGPKRPRAEIVSKLGEENQGAPVLLLAENSKVPASIQVSTANGIRFISDPQHIVNYLGLSYDGGMPL